MDDILQDEGPDPAVERALLARVVRQRLESLRRAGVDRIPAARLALGPPPRVSTPPRSSAPASPAPMPSPTPGKPVEAPPRLEPKPPAPRPVPAAAPAILPPEPAPAPVGSLFGEPTLDVPMVAPEDRPRALEALAAEVAACRRCPILVANRTQTVFGVGSPTARLMFVGEAPGADEDRQGVPFVGKAGSLLTDMITKGMGLTREEVYIANVVKSRPPENRTPEPDEIANCLPFLQRQIEIVRPEFLCLLGKVAASALLDTALPLARLRGRWHRYRGIPVAVTYHPAYLLRYPAEKKKAWEDLQMVMKSMGIAPPARRKASEG